MSYCVQCGSPVPDAQNTCSMCYGDIDHGSDGYYREWAEQREREWEQERERTSEKGAGDAE